MALLYNLLGHYLFFVLPHYHANVCGVVLKRRGNGGRSIILLLLKGLFNIFCIKAFTFVSLFVIGTFTINGIQW